MGVGLPIGSAVFFLYYLPYKERVEGKRLLARHGPAFRAYREAVPALLPRLRAYRPASADAAGSESGWGFDRVVGNDELGTALAVGFAFAVLCVEAWLH
jgi:hypothetical protein